MNGFVDLVGMGDGGGLSGMDNAMLGGLDQSMYRPGPLDGGVAGNGAGFGGMPAGMPYGGEFCRDLAPRLAVFAACLDLLCCMQAWRIRWRWIPVRVAGNKWSKISSSSLTRGLPKRLFTE